MAEDIILDVKSISKHFGALKAVDKVSFQARKGEIIGLIGPNGAGKTTITNLVNGDLKKTHGEVFFKGINVSKMQPFQIARIGLTRTYQVVKPLEGMTVVENVLVGSLFGRENRNNSLTHAKNTAEEILKLVGLNKKKDYLVSDVTLPDLKRIEFARVMAMDPEVVFLDEVMAGLNSSEVEETMKLVKKIRDEKNLTIIYIEHIMKSVMGISDRIIVLHHGKKICEGPPQEVCDNPAVVEAYLGKKYAKEVINN